MRQAQSFLSRRRQTWQALGRTESIVIADCSGSIKGSFLSFSHGSCVGDSRDCSHNRNTLSRGIRSLGSDSLSILPLSAGPWLLQSQRQPLLTTRSIVRSVSSWSPLRLACKARSKRGCSPICRVQVVSPVSLSAVQESDLLNSSCFFIRLCTDVQDTLPSQAIARG